MLNYRLRSYYTHISEESNHGYEKTILQPGIVYQEQQVNRALEIINSYQNTSLKYRLSDVDPWQTVMVAPPYAWTYGVNKLTQSTGNYTGSKTHIVHSDPDYAYVYHPLTTPVAASQNFAERFSNLKATLTVNSANNCSIVAGAFVNKVRTIQVSTLPFYLLDRNVHRIYYVKNTQGAYYDPGVDYVYDPQTGEFSIEGLDTALTEDITVEVAYSVYTHTQVEVELSSGSIELPPSLYYGFAIKAPEGTSTSWSFSVQWESVLDAEEPDDNYVLCLATSNGLRTLASLESDTIEVEDSLTPQAQAQFLDFQDVIRSSSSLPAWSDASIDDEFTYAEYSVWANMLAPRDEYRYTRYDLTVADNPAEVSEEEVVLNNPQEGVDGSPTRIYYGKQLYKLPDVQGLLKYGSNRLDRSYLNKDILDQFQKSSEAIIPSSRTGWLAVPYIKPDMRFITPESAGWGLLLASSYRDDAFCLLGLQELINQAKKKQWIVDNGDGYVVSDNQAGFGLYFSQVDIPEDDPEYSKLDENFKEVGANAFLGFAACVALATITDNKIINAFATEGSWVTFRTELLATLEALALFVCDGVSLVSFFAAYKFHNGVFSFNTPSMYATTYADYFLSYFLSFKYNHTVHHVAARLKEKLDNLPVDLNNPIYGGNGVSPGGMFDSSGNLVGSSGSGISTVMGELHLNALRLFEDFETVDVDADGLVSYAEAQTMVATLTQEQFDSIDANADGFLSRAELSSKLLGVGEVGGSNSGSIGGDFSKGIFTERDYQATQYPYDPAYLYTADPESNEVKAYDRLMTLASIANWSSDNQTYTDWPSTQIYNTDLTLVDSLSSNVVNTTRAKAAQDAYRQLSEILTANEELEAKYLYSDSVIYSSYFKLEEPGEFPSNLDVQKGLWAVTQIYDLKNATNIAPALQADIQTGYSTLTSAQRSGYISLFYVTGGQTGVIRNTSNSYYKFNTDIINLQQTAEDAETYNIGTYGFAEVAEQDYRLGHIFGTYLTKGGPTNYKQGYFNIGEVGTWYCQGGCNVYYYFRTIPAVPNLESLDDISFEVVNNYWYAVYNGDYYKIDFIYPNNYSIKDMSDARGWPAGPFSPHGPGIMYVDPDGPCYGVTDYISPAVGANPVATYIKYF